MTLYFTDREYGAPQRTKDSIDSAVWGGIFAVISARLSDNSLGYRFPESCPDGYGVSGYDAQMLHLMLGAEVPRITWPLSVELPETPVILDFLEFVAASIGKPIEGQYHSFFRHHHLSFDRDEGLRSFVASVNALFARNGVAYELTNEGQARRLVPEELRQSLSNTLFHSGDTESDRLLETARKQITSPHLEARKDAIEKLWDAFERIKTLEPGNNKREQADALLNKSASGEFRIMLGSEAMQLTSIGNSFRIRHSETTQEPLTQSEQVDYLFHRMFSFIRFVLKATGRAD